MNFAAVVILLREVLEAAVLGSLLLALAQRVGLGSRWFWLALVVGTVGAWAYADAIGWVSELWDYTGQEVVNAAIQFGIFITFVLLLLALRQPDTPGAWITATMGVVIALTLTRELSEILLYLQNYGAGDRSGTAVLLGASVGFFTGISVGVVLYVFATWVADWRRAQRATLITLCIVIAGILTQAVSLLLQVDRLPHSAPLWNSETLISERGITGQLLYALVGYEATPTHWHVAVWLLSLAVMLPLTKTRHPAEAECP